MFVLSLIIFFSALVFSFISSLPLHSPLSFLSCSSLLPFFPSVHFSTFLFAFTLHSMMYTSMHESIWLLSMCARYIFFMLWFHHLSLSLHLCHFHHLLPNFFTCVSSMSKNYILFSFKFLFRWRAMQLEWWMGRVRKCARPSAHMRAKRENKKKTGNQHFLSRVSLQTVATSPTTSQWWVEDEWKHTEWYYLFTISRRGQNENERSWESENGIRGKKTTPTRNVRARIAWNV